MTDILVCTSTGGRSTNKRDDTPLLDAVGTDKLDLVEILVNKGADVNEVNSEDHAPLLLTWRSGPSKLLKL
jgi:ankyrin repeat protein